jgi:Asp-tRNA(Asn)/Glu-tRNA(Gln) amidotransferase A subunit family amidase
VDGMRGTTPDARSLQAAWVAVRRGDLDPVTFADQICTRIESVDTDLQAFVDEPDRRKRMAAEAGELLRRWPDPRDRPPLFGVPLGVKDVVHVNGLPTAAGARLPVDVLAGPDAAEAPVVASLREAGALVVGKKVTVEVG